MTTLNQRDFSSDQGAAWSALPSDKTSRRSFVKAMSAALAAAIGACGTFDISAALAQSGAVAAAIDVGAGDIGILNLTFALEQVETAFYTLVLERPYRGMTAYEC